MKSSILRRRRLSFPGGNPGFDPSHPCAKGTVVSAIPIVNNIVNLLTGVIGFNNPVAPASGLKIRAYIGPAIGCTNASNQGLAFTSLPTPVSPYTATLAGIFSVNALHNGAQQICENQEAGQLQLGIFNNTLQLNRWNGSNANTTFTPIVGVPYFFAASTDNTNVSNLVWTRLDTGVIRSFTTGGSATVPNGANYQFSIGESSGGIASDVWIGPTMWSTSVCTLSELLKWAGDPWSFWYPYSSYNLEDNLLSTPSGGVADVLMAQIWM